MKKYLILLIFAMSFNVYAAEMCLNEDEQLLIEQEKEKLVEHLRESDEYEVPKHVNDVRDSMDEVDESLAEAGHEKEPLSAQDAEGEHSFLSTEEAVMAQKSKLPAEEGGFGWAAEIGPDVIFIAIGLAGAAIQLSIDIKNHDLSPGMIVANTIVNVSAAIFPQIGLGMMAAQFAEDIVPIILRAKRNKKIEAGIKRANAKIYEFNHAKSYKPTEQEKKSLALIESSFKGYYKSLHNYLLAKVLVALPLFEKKAKKNAELFKKIHAETNKTFLKSYANGAYWTSTEKKKLFNLREGAQAFAHLYVNKKVLYQGSVFESIFRQNSIDKNKYPLKGCLTNGYLYGEKTIGSGEKAIQDSSCLKNLMNEYLEKVEDRIKDSHKNAFNLLGANMKKHYFLSLHGDDPKVRKQMCTDTLTKVWDKHITHEKNKSSFLNLAKKAIKNASYAAYLTKFDEHGYSKDGACYAREEKCNNYSYIEWGLEDYKVYTCTGGKRDTDDSAACSPFATWTEDEVYYFGQARDYCSKPYAYYRGRENYTCDIAVYDYAKDSSAVAEEARIDKLAKDYDKKMRARLQTECEAAEAKTSAYINGLFSAQTFEVEDKKLKSAFRDKVMELVVDYQKNYVQNIPINIKKYYTSNGEQRAACLNVNNDGVSVHDCMQSKHANLFIDSHGQVRVPNSDNMCVGIESSGGYLTLETCGSEQSAMWVFNDLTGNVEILSMDYAAQYWGKNYCLMMQTNIDGNFSHSITDCGASLGDKYTNGIISKDIAMTSIMYKHRDDNNKMVNFCLSARDTNGQQSDENVFVVACNDEGTEASSSMSKMVYNYRSQPSKIAFPEKKDICVGLAKGFSDRNVTNALSPVNCSEAPEWSVSDQGYLYVPNFKAFIAIREAAKLKKLRATGQEFDPYKYEQSLLPKPSFNAILPDPSIIPGRRKYDNNQYVRQGGRRFDEFMNGNVPTSLAHQRELMGRLVRAKRLDPLQSRITGRAISGAAQSGPAAVFCLKPLIESNAAVISTQNCESEENKVSFTEVIKIKYTVETAGKKSDICISSADVNGDNNFSTDVYAVACDKAEKLVYDYNHLPAKIIFPKTYNLCLGLQQEYGNYKVVKQKCTEAPEWDISDNSLKPMSLDVENCIRPSQTNVGKMELYSQCDKSTKFATPELTKVAPHQDDKKKEESKESFKLQHSVPGQDYLRCVSVNADNNEVHSTFCNQATTVSFDYQKDGDPAKVYFPDIAGDLCLGHKRVSGGSRNYQTGDRQRATPVPCSNAPKWYIDYTVRDDLEKGTTYVTKKLILANDNRFCYQPDFYASEIILFKSLCAKDFTLIDSKGNPKK